MEGELHAGTEGLLSVWSDGRPARTVTLLCPSSNPHGLPFCSTLSVTACSVVGGTLGLANMCLSQAWTALQGGG